MKNKRHFLSVLILLCSTTQAFTQENTQELNNKRNSFDIVHVIGYGGLLTIGYQHLITNRIGIEISAASLALVHEDLRDGFCFPVHLSFYPIGQENRLFFDFGCNIITKGKSNPIFDFYDGINVPVIFGSGYCYHPNDGGFFLKSGFGLFLYNPNISNELIKPGTFWAISVGTAF